MWDQRYSGETYVCGTEPNEFLAAMLEELPDGKVLCLGEGEFHNWTGAVLRALAGKP